MYSMGFSYGVDLHLAYTGVGSQYCLLDFLKLVGFGIVFSEQPTGRDRCYLLDLSPSGSW
ncbi:hypothetical protein KAM478_37920 [Aeromonas caviae]|nr:hypothetical protein KAM478_37920 [Aeromonas caviae]